MQSKRHWDDRVRGLRPPGLSLLGGAAQERLPSHNVYWRYPGNIEGILCEYPANAKRQIESPLALKAGGQLGRHKRDWFDTADESRRGQDLQRFIDDSPVEWAKGTRLSETNPYPKAGFRGLTEVCLRKLVRRGEYVDSALVKWVGLPEVQEEPQP